jgi:DNA-binding IclR family transcriptional regulator
MAVLRFYESRRPVRTASYVQVRQPIYKTAVGRARRYQRHLEPLLRE